jgi:hypothetical protein
MTTTVQIQSEYRDLPLDWLVVSPTNPRKTFDQDAMQELADYVPGHIVGLLLRWSFCGGDSGQPHWDRQYEDGSAHNGWIGPLHDANALKIPARKGGILTKGDLRLSSSC